MEVHSLVHLIGWPLDIGIESLESLLDRQQEYHVDENDAVGTNEVEHLEGLGIAKVGAVSYFVHLLNDGVAPDVQAKHPWQDYACIEDPDPEAELARADLENRVGQQL